MHLHEQIAAVFAKTGWTVAELLAKSGLELHRTQLNRRLTGRTPMKTEEAELLATTLRKHGFEITLVWPPKRTKGAA